MNRAIQDWKGVAQAVGFARGNTPLSDHAHLCKRESDTCTFPATYCESRRSAKKWKKGRINIFSYFCYLDYLSFRAFF